MTVEIIDRHPSPEGEVVTLRIADGTTAHIHTRYANPDGDEATISDAEKFAADNADRIGL